MTETTPNTTAVDTSVALDATGADLRHAFELALLQQLQSGEMSAAWGEIARKYLADREAAARWQAERADLEMTAQKERTRETQQRADLMSQLPFPKRPVQDASPAPATGADQPASRTDGRFDQASLMTGDLGFVGG
jgi:hypothetical protein